MKSSSVEDESEITILPNYGIKQDKVWYVEDESEITILPNS